MGEWLVEEGIAEHRAIRLDGGTIAAARVDWPRSLAAGLVADAVLVSRATGVSRGTLRFASGEEALADRLPRDAAEGALLRVIVTRAAVGERGRLKRAHARPSTADLRSAPTLAQRLREAGHPARIVRAFPEGDWDELFAEAWTGEASFSGGALLASPTPAMTVIDIDGILPLPALACAAVPALASLIGRLDLAGSIGIDFPTLSDKGDRRAVDQALDAALAHWPHERTAINGFGFVQLVARMEAPSYLQRVAADRCGAAARLLLRRAERIADPGALLLTARPGVRAAVRPEWQEELARRTGRPIVWREDRTLALDGGFAQAIAV